MKLGINLNIKPELRQKLAITPLLRQSLELLALNMPELEQIIITELEQNPLLKDSSFEYAIEKGSEDGHGADLDEGDKTLASESESGESAKEREIEPDTDKYEINEEAWTNVFSELPRASNSSLYRERPDLEQINAIKSTLKEHLEWQLRLSTSNEGDYMIGMNIIGNLNTEGFITHEDLEAISRSLDAEPEKIESIRSLIKAFDPVGIASVSITECLLAQLRARDYYHPVIEKVLNKHFDALKAGYFDEILNDKEIDLSADDLRLILEVLSKLDPRPGCHFDDREDNNTAILPDIIIRYESGDYIIELNENIRPMLYIPPNYLNLLSSKAPENQKDRNFLRQKLARAQWLLKSIEQRRQTLLKVGKAFISFQRDFLDKGPKYLKPMILKDVADECGIHSSTVQRIVNQKYIDTPRGTYLLKFFFSRAIPKSGGDAVSNITLKRNLKQLIEGEDVTSPLSDLELQSIIEKSGVQISRRAIAKYRSELGIPNSNKRKRKKQIL